MKSKMAVIFHGGCLIKQEKRSSVLNVYKEEHAFDQNPK